MVKYLFIVAEFNNGEEVFDFYEKVSALTNERFVFIVASNGDYNALNLVFENTQKTDLHLINMNRNMGYMPAANQAMSFYLNKYEDYPEYVFVSNTDIGFKFDNLDLILDSVSSDCDVIAPSITNLFGEQQNPFLAKRISVYKLRFLIFINSFYVSFFLYFYLSLFKRFLFSRFNRRASGSYIYAPHGSFIIFKKTFFSKGGDLDFKSFLYGEEIYVAEVCRINSLKVLYEPSINLMHLEHSTTSALDTWSKAKFIKQSLLYLKSSFFNG